VQADLNPDERIVPVSPIPDHKFIGGKTKEIERTG
jgi:hypothetical protein